MPHVKIWHFETTVPQEKQNRFVEEVTSLLVETFGCPPDAVSLDTVPVPPATWDCVFEREIEPHLPRLWKTPDYQ
jgi:phenylpyruvate tautomerase PptA (4-oxalocrotonate tautomerase family)